MQAVADRVLHAHKPMRPDRDMHINHSTLKFDSYLGRGACGVAYHGFWTGHDGVRREVAIKMFDPQSQVRFHPRNGPFLWVGSSGSVRESKVIVYHGVWTSGA